MMKKHPLRTGLVLLLGMALLFFLTVYFSASMTNGVTFLGDRIGLVKIEGIIAESREVIQEIHEYKKDPGVKAILLRINSPGGGVVPSQEIYEEVRKIRDEGQKKVFVSMGTVAASGGYYIASASDRIIANPGTLTGSIGVIMELANVEGLLKKIGVESLVIKSGRHKDTGSPFRKMQPEEREILQRLLDDVHEQFVQAVSQGRGLPEEEVRKFSDGRIFTGRQAKEMGLVDDLGNLQDAIQLAADIVGIKGEPRVVEKRKRMSWLERLTNKWPGNFPGVEIPKAGISLNYLMAF
jgi:protease IV